MIVQTTRISRNGGIQYLARHLLDKVDDNDKIEVLSGDRLALHDAQALAKAKGAKYSVRHLSISSQGKMTPKQLASFIRSIDVEFGIGPDRPRLVVRHLKKGRSHFHVAIAEVDPVTLRVLDCRHDYKRLEAIARQYEQNHGETVQPTRTERRQCRIQGFSDVARKRAERIGPMFDRTKLKNAYASGLAAFLVEVENQGFRITQGEKGSILVDASGTFVAAANRTVGIKRQSFEKALKESIHAQQLNGNTDLSQPFADDGGKDHFKPSATPDPPAAPARTRQDYATSRDARLVAGQPTPTGACIEVSRRQGRSSHQTLIHHRRHEELFLRRLGKVDLDDLLRRAQALANLIRSIFESPTDRFSRQIQDIKKRKLFPPADAALASGPTYNPSRRPPL